MTRFVLYVAAGAGAALLVPAAIILWSPMPPRAVFAFGPADGWPGDVPDDWPAPNGRYRRSNRVLTQEFVVHRPPTADVWPEDSTGVYLTSEVIRVGWPVRSMQTWRRQGTRPHETTGWFNGFEVPERIATKVGARRSGPIPCGPIWGGLVVGTAMCTVAVWLAVSVVRFAWRAVGPYPPGHCRRCGYLLRGLPGARCPECGGEAIRGA